LLSLATIYDGGSRSDAARIGDVGLQIIRDWVLRFNAAGPDGLVDRKAPGPEPRLNEDHRAALAAAIESGPIPAIHSVVRWRLVDLCQWLWEEFRVSIARQTLSFPAIVAEIAQDKRVEPAAIEIWFADEARIGQKNRITRRWARRGTRPAAPSDQRTASTDIFGAICPALGKGAALVLPRCNTAAMNLHLAEITQAVAPGAHAVLLVDQAGWHLSHRLVIPQNITIVALPPKCPELNPVENIWQAVCSLPTGPTSPQLSHAECIGGRGRP
jgi:transposase